MQKYFKNVIHATSRLFCVFLSLQIWYKGILIYHGIYHLDKTTTKTTSCYVQGFSYDQDDCVSC